MKQIGPCILMLLVSGNVLLGQKQPKELKSPDEKVLAQVTPSVDAQLLQFEKELQNGEHEAARRVLSSIKCNGEKSCDAKVKFGFGYLSQAIGDAAGLREAIQAYRGVIELYPDNKAAHKNMAGAYSKLGLPNNAIEILLAYPVPKPPDISEMLGDLCFEQKKYRESLRWLLTAAASDPSLTQVHEKAVHLYGLVKVRPDSILRHCSIMKTVGLTDLMVEATRTVILQNYQTDVASSERASLWWAQLTGDRATTNLTDLPASWEHPGVVELKRVFEDLSLENVKWWRSQERQRIERSFSLSANVALGHALRGLAASLEDRGQFGRARQAYEASYQSIIGGNPDVFLMRVETIPTIFYQSSTELGSFYIKHPEQDPDGSRFENLERDLFDGKSDAYLNQESEAIARFHTTLGLIYYAKGQWTSDRRFRDGIYQLQSAIQRSDPSKNTGALKLMLSTGELSIGETEAAKGALLSAVMSFLNNDDFLSARTTLSQYESLGGLRQGLYPSIKALLTFREQQNDFSAGQLATIKTMRDRVTQLADAAIAAGENREYGSQIAPFVSQAQRSSPTRDFGMLQKFKIYSDLGDRAAGYAKPYYHSLAVQQSRSLTAFANLSDVARLSRDVTSIKEHVTLLGPPSQVKLIAWASALSNEKIWKVCDTSGFDSQSVILPNSTFTGASFTSLSTQFIIAGEGAFLLGQKPVITDGSVIMPDGETPREFKNALAAAQINLKEK